MGLNSMRSVIGAMTLDQLERRYSQGRGRGEGATYKPWLYCRELKSRGMSHVRKSIWVDREVHLLSGIEDAAFMAVQRLTYVKDVREQYPLWPLSSTQKIAEELDILHPRTPNSAVDNLMTTDLVLTVDDGRGTVPIHVKPAEELDDRRVQQKIDIEREWWRRHNAKLRIVTERELPRELVVNLSAAASHFRLEQCSVGAATIDEVASALADSIRRKPELGAAALAAEVDSALGLDAGKTLMVFWYLVSRSRLRIDLHARFDTSLPFDLIAPEVR